MIKLIIGLLFLLSIVFYNGVSTYKDVETLSDLGSLINVYLSAMTASILMAFGLDDIRR